MTHTIILDEAERDRRMVNHQNEIKRHCRIGRVEEKEREVELRRYPPGFFHKPPPELWSA